MNIFEDLILVQKSTIKKSIKSLIKNWPIIFTGIVYMTISLLLTIVLSRLFVGPLSILAGLISAVISSALISNYLYLLFNIINYNKINLNNFKEGFTAYLWKVYEVFFIVWLASYLLSSVSNIAGGSGGVIISLIYLLAFILLNALPETIYQKYYSAFESINYSFEFIKENWLNWFVPNIILFGILYLVTGELITDMFTTYISFNISSGINGIIRYIVGQLIFSFAMIYRGYLFKLLSTSSMRKRMFMRKLED